MVLFGWGFLVLLTAFSKAMLLYDFARLAKGLLPSDMVEAVVLLESHPESRCRIFGVPSISEQERRSRQLKILGEVMRGYSVACDGKYRPEHHEQMSKILELLAGLECQVLPHERIPRVSSDFNTLLHLMKRAWPFLFTKDADFLWSSLRRSTVKNMHGLILRFLPFSSNLADHASFRSVFESEPRLTENSEEVHLLCSLEYLLNFSGRLRSYRSSSEAGISLQDGMAKTIEYLISRVDPSASAFLLRQVAFLAIVQAPGLLSLFLNAKSDGLKTLSEDPAFYAYLPMIYQRSQRCLILLLSACRLGRKVIDEMRQFPMLMSNWNVKLALDICEQGVVTDGHVKFWDLPEALLAMNSWRAAQGTNSAAVELSQDFISFGLSFALYHFCGIPFEQTEILWSDETYDLWEYQGVLDFFTERHCANTGLTHELRLFISNAGARLPPLAGMAPADIIVMRRATLLAIRSLAFQPGRRSLVAL